MHQQANTPYKHKETEHNKQRTFGTRNANKLCRPSFPYPIRDDGQVIYSHSVFDALRLALRPCAKCPPEIFVEESDATNSAINLVNRSLSMICKGYLLDNSLADLSGELGVTDRYLRVVFAAIVGVPPIAVARHYKALLVRSQLLFSQSTITDIALASGFGSIRQCNDVVKTIFDKTPTQIRKDAAPSWCSLRS